MELSFSLDHQTIRRTDSQQVVAGSQNYLTARFTPLSDDWHAPVTAIFGAYSVILDDNLSCTIPWEATETAGSMEVSAFCDDLHTANISTVVITETGYKQGETPKPPTPDVYSQILATAQSAKDTAQSVRDDADAGVFNGKDGEPGKDGLDGKPGRNGVDGAKGDKGEPGLTPEEHDAVIQATTNANVATTAANDAANAANLAVSRIDNQPTNHTQGTLVHVEDAYATQPLKLVTQGKTQVNLFPNTLIYEISATGQSFTQNEDGSATVGIDLKEQTPYLAIGIDYNSQRKLTLGKEYTLTCYGGSNKVWIQLNISHIDDESLTIFSTSYKGGDSITFTVPENAKDFTYIVLAGTGDGSTYKDNVTIYPMLVEGSEPKPWTPSGITCVSELKVEQRGKNLLDKSVLRIFNHSKYVETANRESKPSVKLVPNTEYVLQFPYAPDDATLYFWRDNKLVRKEYPSSSSHSKTNVFRTRDGENGLSFYYGRLEGVLSEIPDAQLEFGSQATPYEPYSGNTTVIDLQGHEACDVPDGTCDQLEITPRADGLANVVYVQNIVGIEINESSPIGFESAFNRVKMNLPIRAKEDYLLGPDIESYPIRPRAYSGTASEGSYVVVGLTDCFLRIDGLTTEAQYIEHLSKEPEKVIYPIEQRRIDLGTVELPKLPSLTANVWSDTNMPEVVTEMDYIQDINVVLDDIRQAIVALPAHI